jgi:hypothetical protein
MPKDGIRGEWYASKEKIEGVLSGKQKYRNWSINYEQLARITNNHPEFLEKVKAFAEKDLDGVYNAAVYRSYSDGDQKETITIVFDVADIYIKIISCRVDHQTQPYVFETSFNKSYVWSMASML